jgi:hypothetical protein
MPRIPRRLKGAEHQPPADSPLAPDEQPTSVVDAAPATDGAVSATAVQHGDPRTAQHGDPLAPPAATGETGVIEAPPGAEHAPPDAAPRFRGRTRMRRRLRYLRRRRELAFRDLGGLVFDLHRFGRDRDDLVIQKLDGLRTIDHELRTIEVALRTRGDVTVLREAGIAACPRCETLHDTDASFCPGCGTPLRGGVADDEATAGVAPAGLEPPPAEQPQAEPQAVPVSAGEPLEQQAQHPQQPPPTVTPS